MSPDVIVRAGRERDICAHTNTDVNTFSGQPNHSHKHSHKCNWTVSFSLDLSIHRVPFVSIVPYIFLSLVCKFRNRSIIRIATNVFFTISNIHQSVWRPTNFRHVPRRSLNVYCFSFTFRNANGIRSFVSQLVVERFGRSCG